LIQDLDTTLAALLGAPGAPSELAAADVSFATPDRTFAPGLATVDLFLHELQERRELRDPVPWEERTATAVTTRPPPLRVDCHYLVTAWGTGTGAAKVAEEHQLLAQAVLWLSRFPEIPLAVAAGSLGASPFPPPTMVAQADGPVKGVDFWTALGIAPRPSFSLVVTLALTLDETTPIGPPVLTKAIRGLGGSVFQIAGTVRAAGTQAPVADALVTVRQLGVTARTDAGGRFTFTGLPPGGYTLRTEHPAFQPRNWPVLVPANAFGAYDHALTP
jgi:hypothetical protein